MDNEENKLEENEIKNDEKIEEGVNQNTEGFIPEQLDDDDFEKEKEEAKRLKKEKKLAKKKKKSKNNEENDAIEPSEILDTEYDEDGNVILKKKNKKKIITIVAIIAIVIAIIGGVIGFFVIHMNKPENIVSDFISYYNSQNWDEVVNCIDFRGLYALNSLEEAKYTEYDSNYQEIESDENYQAFKEFLDNRLEMKDDILNTFMADSQMTLEEIISVEKIENTESLYKIKATATVSVGSESSTQTFNIYVSKVDGKYKLVGGELPLLIEYAFELSVNYEF